MQNSTATQWTQTTLALNKAINGFYFNLGSQTTTGIAYPAQISGQVFVYTGNNVPADTEGMDIASSHPDW